MTKLNYFKKINNKFDTRRFVFCAFGAALVGTLGFLTINNLKNTQAADLSQFRAGNIMSDEVMGNYGSMSEAEIYNFMHSVNNCNNTATYMAAWYPSVSYHIENGHFVCLADEWFDGESSAHIIWQAAQDYRINPQVLIVLLQKEQGLITDDWPHSGQYRAATGFGCPDTAACDAQYYGFKNQVRNAANLFRKVLDGGWSNYPAYTTQYVQYNPDPGCGGTNVYIENRATSALYRYTPYQPNAGALAAGYGGDAVCGAYGNRNFYAYFTDWFGDTHNNEMTRAHQWIENTYNNIGGASRLGNPIGTIGYSRETATYYQQYELGYIVGSNATGYFESFGKIRDYWASRGFETSRFGLPTSNVIHNEKTNVWYQDFQYGSIAGNDEIGYHESVGLIREYWKGSGFEYGQLGLPTSDEFYTASTDTYYQYYEHGAIVGRNNLGFHISTGGIRDTWAQLGFESGQLGLPITDIDYNPGTKIYYQQYERGFIVGNDEKGYFQSTGLIREYWKWSGFESGALGFPTSNEFYNPTTDIYWQNYENGVVVGRNNLGFHISTGGIRETWQRLGFETGPLGMPITDIDNNPWTGIYYQQYEGGFIVGNDEHGYYESRGSIRGVWQQNGFEMGRLGFPTSNIQYDSATGTEYQTYEHGKVLYKNGVGSWIE